MAVAHTSGYCHVCQQQRMMVKPRINHVLHLILTLVTVGIWGIVWIALGIISASKGSRCTVCGTKMGHGAAGPALQATVTPVERGPVSMPEIPEGPPEKP